MSRCFPFPPPGYERKARSDDENWLEKEKRKEKKNKKEKKDKKKDKKEKKDREGKQKVKERRKEKHREKKDRSERDKEKKDKKKEKKRPSEDKNTSGQPDSSTVDNPGSSGTQSDETSDLKNLVELGKRNRKDHNATENLMVKKINLTGNYHSEFPGKVSVSNTANSDGKAMLTQNKTNDREFRGQSNDGNARGTESGIAKNIVLDQQRKVVGVGRMVGNNVDKRMIHKEIDEHNKSESRYRSNDRDREEMSKLSKEMKLVKEPNKQQLIDREKSRNPVSKDSNIGSLPLSNESNKNFNLGKRKESRINGFLHDDEIRPFKLQRPMSWSQEFVENGRSTKPSKTLTKLAPKSMGMVHHPEVNSKLASFYPTAEGGSKFNANRSEIQFASAKQSTGDNHTVNNSVPVSRCSTLEKERTSETRKAGTLLVPDCYRGSIDNKVDDKVVLAHPVLEDGEIEVHKAAMLTADGGNEATGNAKFDNKDHEVGLIKDNMLNSRSTKPSSSTIKQIVEKPPKPPHPDIKYLSKILSVPSIKWPEFDDQEWLMDSNSLQKKEANPCSSRSEETNQVWAKAFHLESADVMALPYVVPY